MTKKLSTSKITNELKGSAWFRQPEKEIPPSKSTKSAKPKKTKNRSTERDVPQNAPVNRADRTAVQTVQPINRADRSTVHHTKNTRTLRRAYELHEDQLTGLRRIRATRELSRDETISFSELVREAIDLLLVKEGIK